MDFFIEFYETDAGRCPVQEFMDDLKVSDPDDFAAILAGLSKLKIRKYHRPPLSKAIGDELFELRHVGRLNTRVIYFFFKGLCLQGLYGERSGLPGAAHKVFGDAVSPNRVFPAWIKEGICQLLYEIYTGNLGFLTACWSV